MQPRHPPQSTPTNPPTKDPKSTHFTFQNPYLKESLSVPERAEVPTGGLLSEGLPGDNLTNNLAGDAHHGGPSVVKLGVLLPNLPLGIPSPVVPLAETDSVVAIKLGCRPPGELNQGTDSKDLSLSRDRYLEEATDALRNIAELQVMTGAQVAIEGPLVVVHNDTKHGHHGDAAVLALHSTVAFELLRGVNVAEGIEEAKRLDGSDRHVLGVEGGGGGGKLRGNRGHEGRGCRD